MEHMYSIVSVDGLSLELTYHSKI